MSTPNFEKRKLTRTMKQVDPNIQEIKEEEEEEKVVKNFKSVIVNDLKDSSNYYRFINNCKNYLEKMHNDKAWFSTEKGWRTVRTVQDKINKHISFNFEDAFEDMEEGKRIIILEIENSICLVTKELIPDCEEPLLTVTINSSKQKQKPKEKINYYVYVRKFGLEFLEFLCKTHDVILYTNLERELAATIIDAFRKIKKFIEFGFLIWGKPFWKHVYKHARPIKSLDNIISDESKDRFLILDSECLSYLEKYEDIYVPILPIVPTKINVDGSFLPNNGMANTMNKVKGRKVHKRQSSQKMLLPKFEAHDVQSSLNNHWLFYLKQLLTQSFGIEYTNTELLKSVSISCLTLEKGF